MARSPVGQLVVGDEVGVSVGDSVDVWVGVWVGVIAGVVVVAWGAPAAGVTVA